MIPSFSPRPSQIAYSDFVALVQAGKVDRALVGNDQIEFTLKPDSNAPAPEVQRPRVYTTTPVAIDLDLPKSCGTMALSLAHHP